MKYLIFLVAGLLIGFLIGEFIPRGTIPLPDLSTYTRQIDSLEAQNSLIGDSLRAAREVLGNREFELGQAHKRTQEALKQKNETIFISYPNDSARMAAWADVFTSLRHR